MIKVKLRDVDEYLNKKNLFSDFKNFSGSTYICTYIHTHMIVLSVIKTQISFPFY